MISAISAATIGMQSATARFDRAAQAVTRGDAFDAQSVSARAPTDIVTPMVDMMTSRLAFTASLQVARTSHDMLAEAIRLGGYGSSAEAVR